MTKKQRSKKGQKWYKSLAGLAVLATLLAALVGGIFVIFAAFVPVWTAPKTLRASLSDLTIESNVSLEEYLKRSKLPFDEYSDDELGQFGYVVHFKVEMEGFKNRECPVIWSVYDAKTKSKIELPDPWAERQEPIELTPEQANDSAADNFCVPNLSGHGAFFVRLEVLDDKGQLLTFKDTESIDVDRAANFRTKAATPSA